MHSAKKFKRVWKSEWGNEIIFCHGQTNARDVAILIKKGLNSKIHDIYRDTEGRILVVNIVIENNRHTIANCYAPNNDNPGYFAQAFAVVESFPNEYRIIAGDFNTILKENGRIGGSCQNHQDSTKFINEYLEQHFLIGIWRCFNPVKFMFMCQREKPYNLMERLDYIIVSSSLHQFITLANIYPSFKSDHSIPTRAA